MFLNNPATNVAVRSDIVPNEREALLRCQAIVRDAAEPWSPGEGVEAGIRRSARRTGISYRRTRTLWYAQPCRLRFGEVTRLQRWHAAWLTRRIERLDAELATLQALEARLRGETVP